MTQFKRKNAFTQDSEKQKAARVISKFMTKAKEASVPKKDVEIKYFETKQLVTVVPSGGAVFQLNPVAQGTDYFNRIGRKVTSQYVDLKFGLVSTVLAVTTNICQVALVLDTEPASAGGVATYAEIFDLAPNAGALAVVPGMAFKNLQINPKRFKILWFEQIPVIGLQLQDSYVQKKFMKIMGDGADCRFAAGTTLAKNELLLCVGTTQNTGVAATDASFMWSCRYAFSDE